MRIYKFYFVVLFLLLGFSLNTNAEWYVGADATNLTYRMSLDTGREIYKLSPARIKFGYLTGSAGFELQAYSGEDDTVTSAGTDIFLKTEEMFGAHFIFSPEERNYYVTVGVVRTKFTNILVGSGATDVGIANLIGFSAGYQYELFSGLFLSADYNYYEGKTQLPNTTASGPGLSQRIPSVLSGFSVGAKYSF